MHTGQRRRGASAAACGCRGQPSPTGCTRLARTARQWRLLSSSQSVGARPGASSTTRKTPRSSSTTASVPRSTVTPYLHSSLDRSPDAIVRGRGPPGQVRTSRFGQDQVLRSRQQVRATLTISLHPRLYVRAALTVAWVDRVGRRHNHRFHGRVLEQPGRCRHHPHRRDVAVDPLRVVGDHPPGDAGGPRRRSANRVSGHPAR
jgi:hypothetical protein